MIASEQSKRDKHKRVSGYIFPLANLIKSPKDVVLLSNYGIIQHEFNDDDQVRRLFHNVANEVVIDVSNTFSVVIVEVDLKMQRQQKLSEKPSTQSRSKCSLRKYTQNHVEAKEKRKLSPNNFDLLGDFAQPPPSAAYAAATTTENPSVGLAIAWSTLETHFLH
ncbi:hypothetical protein LguiA_033124 [Lonicera macranthoides]